MVWVEVAGDGCVAGCRLSPMRIERFRLITPTPADRRWLADVLDRESRPFSTAVAMADDHHLTVHPHPSPTRVGA